MAALPPGPPGQRPSSSSTVDKAERPVITERQLRRHLLAKQHLTPRTAGPNTEVIADDLVGLHATGTTSPYLQLLARMTGFRRSDLDRALYPDRTLARLRCMRGTVFCRHAKASPDRAGGHEGSIEPPSTRYLAMLGVDLKDFRRLADRIERELERTGEALSAAELRARTGAKTSLSGVINLMCDQARLLRDRPVGAWKSRTFTYRRFGEVFPHLGSMDEDHAVRLLTERYVRAHGPVTMDDLVWWSGLALRKLQPALRDLGDAVVKVEIDGVPREYLGHAAEVDHVSPRRARRGALSGLAAPRPRPLPDEPEEARHDPRSRAEALYDRPFRQRDIAHRCRPSGGRGVGHLRDPRSSGPSPPLRWASGSRPRPDPGSGRVSRPVLVRKAGANAGSSLDDSLRHAARRSLFVTAGRDRVTLLAPFQREGAQMRSTKERSHRSCTGYSRMWMRLPSFAENSQTIRAPNCCLSIS
jgi:hypothetical protein